MSRSPRLAVGSVQADADSQWITWGLMGAMRSLGLEVQHFFGRSCLPTIEGATSITGTSSRHLDSWLMSPELCRELYFHGARNTDLSIIEGRYGQRRRIAECTTGQSGGTLEQLCDWLSLPKLVVIDVATLSLCELPALPSDAAGLLLDNVPGLCGLARFQTLLEPVYQLPVLGALPEAPKVRQEIARLRSGSLPSADLCHDLGLLFARHAQLDRLLELSERQLPHRRRSVGGSLGKLSAQPRIAVAYDSAFNLYFPDTLEQLELNGAEVATFSPLQDEQLPAGCDILYIGAGQPDQYARMLSDNQCMLTAVRDFFHRGGRIYAESGGLAYLCQAMEASSGSCLPMVGALPAVARAKRAETTLIAAEAEFSSLTWLGCAGSKLRGYSPERWQLEFSSATVRGEATYVHGNKLFSRRHLVGSLLHVNFASQPALLRQFFSAWPGVPAPITVG